jgi:hypothetical protein
MPRAGVCGRAASIALIALIAGGLTCATAPPPAPPPPPAEPQSAEAIAALGAPPAVRLMWLPVDAIMHPKLAAAINDKLAAARLPGLTAQDRAPVSMETAQLSLECSQPTPECHAAVGRHLRVNRLLWAEIQRPRRKRGVAVTLSLFDVDKAAMVARAERLFPNEPSALAGLDTLVTELASSAGPEQHPTSQASTAAR